MSVTNDSVRGLFKKVAMEKINSMDKIVQYLKVKGWIGTPPLYKNVPQNVNEMVTTIDVANLWDHLTYRYDNVHTTEVMLHYARDLDFKLTLGMGLKTLTEQVDMLEKELEYFAIPLPKRPGKVTMTPSNTEILNDDHMYRTLLIGLQGAAQLHVQPLKECTFNDRTRGIFKKLLIDEINCIDKYYKFGKLKGWFHPIPVYGV